MKYLSAICASVFVILFFCTPSSANVPNYWGKVVYLPTQEKEEIELKNWMKQLGRSMSKAVAYDSSASPYVGKSIGFHRVKKVFSSTAVCRFRLYKKNVKNQRVAKIGKVISSTENASKYALAAFPVAMPKNDLPFERDIEVKFKDHTVILRFIGRDKETNSPSER